MSQQVAGNGRLIGKERVTEGMVMAVMEGLHWRTDMPMKLSTEPYLKVSSLITSARIVAV